MLSSFGGLRLKIAEGWADISADLPPGSPPTLARGTGIGVLQFSVARYQHGAMPTVDEDALRRLFIEFCQTHALRELEPAVQSTSRGLCVGGISVTPEEVVGAWYLSDGSDIALVTYTALGSADPAIKEELLDAQGMVQSIEFR